MKKKATSSSSPSIWAEAERRIVQAYSEIQEIWYRSLDLQVDLSKQLQSETTVSEETLNELAREFGAMLKKLREGFSKVRPYLSEADSKYTIFSDLEDLIVEYLESLKLLPKEKDAFLGQTGHKNTRYTFWNLAYLAEQQKRIRINGELLLFVSPLANLLDELLYEMPLDYTEAEVDFLIRQRVEKERGYLLQRLPGVVSLVVSKEQSKPKKSRNPEAIRKEKDYLYLLDRYESWKAKKTKETGRKKLNPKAWLLEYDLWNRKTLAIYRKYVFTKSKDGTSHESDPSSKYAQGRIDSIIKYAQKIKRERSEGGE